MRRSRDSAADDLANLVDREHILSGLELAMARWHEVTALAFEADHSDDFVESITRLLGVDQIQATAIADTQLRRGGRLERENISQHLADVRQQLADRRP